MDDLPGRLPRLQVTHRLGNVAGNVRSVTGVTFPASMSAFKTNHVFASGRSVGSSLRAARRAAIAVNS
jgi:hypothetical protein